MSSYIILGIFSFRELRKYLKLNKYVDYDVILPSTLSPSISLIAPAYNEGKNIVENIRSLLSIHYSNYEVVIINDGSKDDTLEKAIEAYKMEPVNFAVEYKIDCKRIKNVYKSTIPALKNLILIDKENGGKADALNAGINVCKGKYVACIDVDCILEQDSLLKMVKPFLQTKTRVIATGGVIRIANDCVIEDGKVTQVRVPRNMLARTQVLEYLRAFLLGRMAWSNLDGLLLISGAFGMFDKEILIKSGGYNHRTVGEDMEVVVRMRRYMIENKMDYAVHFIPDPLCWTEVPAKLNILVRQRNRWTRGNIETLWIHRKMFFNPQYKVLGLLSYPYWFFNEFLAPIIEFLGILALGFFVIFGFINWTSFFLLFAMIYSFTIMFSTSTLMAEEFTYYQYKNYKDIFKLLLAGIIEPFFFHPIVLYSAIQGNLDLIDGKKNWGDMTRQGFEKQTQTQAV